LRFLPQRGDTLHRWGEILQGGWTEGKALSYIGGKVTDCSYNNAYPVMLCQCTTQAIGDEYYEHQRKV